MVFEKTHVLCIGNFCGVISARLNLFGQKTLGATRSSGDTTTPIGYCGVAKVALSELQTLLRTVKFYCRHLGAILRDSRLIIKILTMSTRQECSLLMKGRIPYGVVMFNSVLDAHAKRGSAQRYTTL